MLAELLAPLLRWPLHSPRRFTAVLATLLIALVAIAAATGSTNPDASGETPGLLTDPVPPPPDQTTTNPTPPASAAATLPPGSHATGGSDVELEAGGTAAARATVVLFVTRWARPDIPLAQWLAELAEVTDPAYLEQLASADLTRVPAAELTGPAEPVVTGAYYAEYLVPTDAGDLALKVTYDGTGWRVVSITPVIGTPPTSRSG